MLDKVSSSCGVPACEAAPAPDSLQIGGEHLCSHHLSLAAPALRKRLDTAIRRARRVEAFWSDDAQYDAIVSSDRYLKLSHVTCCAEEHLEAAWDRVRLSVLMHLGQARPSSKPASAEAHRASA